MNWHDSVLLEIKNLSKAQRKMSKEKQSKVILNQITQGWRFLSYNNPELKARLDIDRQDILKEIQNQLGE